MKMKKILIWTVGIFVVIIFLGLLSEEEQNAITKDAEEVNVVNKDWPESTIKENEAIEKPKNTTIKETTSEEKPKETLEKNKQGSSDKIEFTGKWTKYLNNPALKEQASGYWFQWPGDPFVLIDGPTYKMWFGANVRDGVTNVGYATSPDGISWILHPEPVLRIGAEGDWDDYSVETPSVIKNSDGTYEMWYTGAGGAATDESAGFDRLHKIGYATSNDGINWVKHKDIVLDVELEEGNYEKFDFAGKADPMIIKENGFYKMWYTGAGNNEQGKSINQMGYATSNDGINWNKHENNPIISVGDEGSWDDGSVSTPSVFFADGKYIMIYTGIDEPEGGIETGSVGCATSTDGINWNKFSEPCIKKGSRNDFDNTGLWGATALFSKEKNIYEIWYSALKLDTDIRVSIGYANIK